MNIISVLNLLKKNITVNEGVVLLRDLPIYSYVKENLSDAISVIPKGNFADILANFIIGLNPVDKNISNLQNAILSDADLACLVNQTKVPVSEGIANQNWANALHKELEFLKSIDQLTESKKLSKLYWFAKKNKMSITEATNFYNGQLKYNSHLNPINMNKAIKEFREALKKFKTDNIELPKEKQIEMLHRVALNNNVKSDDLLQKTREMFGKNNINESKNKTFSPAFKNWFGDSKVVDKNGNPLVVFHGTADEFDEFKGTAYHQMRPIFFTSDNKLASDYAAHAEYSKYSETDTFGNIVPVYLSMKNPLIVDTKGKTLGYLDAEDKLDEIISEANKKGCDGVIFKNSRDPIGVSYVTDEDGDLGYEEHENLGKKTDIFAVFNKNQIKSIFNKGNFDPNSNNISEDKYPSIRKANLTPEEREKIEKLPIQKSGWLADIEKKNIANHYDNFYKKENNNVCANCDGNGVLDHYENRCPVCRGKGKINESMTINPEWQTHDGKKLTIEKLNKSLDAFKKYIDVKLKTMSNHLHVGSVLKVASKESAKLGLPNVNDYVIAFRERFGQPIGLYTLAHEIKESEENRSLIRVDQHGKNIVFEKDGYSIAVDDPNNAKYISLWKDNKKIGDMTLGNGRTSDTKGYAAIEKVNIDKKYQGQGLGKELYKTALKYIGDKYKGIGGENEQRSNNKQVPSIYKSLGGKQFESGDFVIDKNKELNQFKQNDIYYHGSDKRLTTLSGAGKQNRFFYLTDNKDLAKEYGKEINQLKISKDAKIVDLSNPEKLASDSTALEAITQYAQENDIDPEVLIQETIDGRLWETQSRHIQDDIADIIGEFHNADVIAIPDSTFGSDPKLHGKTFIVLNKEKLELPQEINESEENKNFTPAFKNWFGNSKVVDKDGNPLVVYHGSKVAFNSFDREKIGSNGTSLGQGFYFTPDRNMAKGYGKEIFSTYLAIKKPLLPNTKPFSKLILIKIIKEIAESESKKNGEPIADGFLSNYADVRYEGVEKAIKEAVDSISMDNAVDQIGGLINSGPREEIVHTAVTKITGYDGIMSRGYGNDEKSSDIYIAWYPNQIKSIKNKGTFDPNSNNINESENKIISSPAFKNWFGDSKVVDKNGNPLMVYHGTDSDFDKFEITKHGKTDFGWYGKGFYFTPNKDLAELYARQNPNGSSDLLNKGSIYTVYLSVKKPFMTDLTSLSDTYVEKLKEEGYDGIFYYEYLQDRHNGSYPTEIIVFNSNQIKSIFNKGNFDPKNNNISESENKTFSPAFKNWFGNSKVVDKNGNPLVVYHGTGSDILSFDKSKANDAEGRKYGVGTGKGSFSFTSDIESANAWANRSVSRLEFGSGNTPNIIPVYLKITNPISRDVFEQMLDKKFDGYNFRPQKIRDKFIQEIKSQLKKEGKDGIISDFGEFTVFEPNQIKSIFNKGNFDPKNNNISESENKTFSPAFKKWFGDSKVVDKDGKPLVVYHGTTSDIKAFDPNTTPNVFEKDRGLFFFTNNTYEAGSYAGGEGQLKQGSNIIPVYLSLKNPYELEITNYDPIDYFDDQAIYIIDSAKEAGYDSVIIENINDGEKLFVAFSPNQIKSIFNKGNFDPNSNNISEEIVSFKTKEKSTNNIDALVKKSKWFIDENNMSDKKNKYQLLNMIDDKVHNEFLKRFSVLIGEDFYLYYLTKASEDKDSIHQSIDLDDLVILTEGFDSSTAHRARNNIVKLLRTLVDSSDISLLSNFESYDGYDNLSLKINIYQNSDKKLREINEKFIKLLLQNGFSQESARIFTKDDIVLRFTPIRKTFRTGTYKNREMISMGIEVCGPKKFAKEMN